MPTRLLVGDYPFFSKRNFQIGLLFLLTGIQIILPSIGKSESCTESIGRMVSIQGEIQIRRNNQINWKPIILNDEICPGDILRAGSDSRAAVALKNESVLRINQHSTLFFPEQKENQPFLLKILDGVIHIFSHRPRALKILTPFVNGAVEGTEFLVRVEPDHTIISVFKGLVKAVNDHGRLDISSDQTVIAGKNTAPKYLTVIRPRDATNWALYYPEIIDRTSTRAAKDRAFPLIRKAADQLALGQVKEAQANITTALKQNPNNSDGPALQAIIMLAENQKTKALSLAEKAVRLAPQSPAANMALSYAQQAEFDIDAALTTLKRASAANPKNALIKAGLAELQLSVGDLEQALNTARDATALNPDIGRTQTVLGFAYLAQVKTDQAQAAFRRAIKLDQSSPLARLGLGLAKIRTGELADGRRDIEIAAALDPENSLIRSYLGKAFYEEKRDSRAGEQYNLAKKLDPMDPTPWLYDAIRKQTINQPVEALHDLEKSIELNDNRAVYRSRLLLDEDLAARSTSLGRIFTDLGFQQTALAEGWKSVNIAPGNYSAHRFLADTYSALPRHEIARVSELLQSQLLQPLNITPVQPRLAESNLFILEGAGPSTLSFNEFNPLFLRNRLALQTDAVLGDNATLGDELTQSGIWNTISCSLGQFHYETNGIRENNDQNLNIYNAFIQSQLSYKTSVTAELRYRKKTYGDLTRQFDPADFSATVRQRDETKSFRLGANHALTPHSNILGTIIYSNEDDGANGINAFNNNFLTIEGSSDSYMGEAQHLYKGRTVNLISGIGYLAADETEILRLSGLPSPLSDTKSSTEHFNAYSYANFNLPYNALVTAGISADFLDSPVADKDQLNPKLGIIWQVRKNTTLRAAIFRSLQRRLIYAQTIEPTQVAGFNQLFDDFEASDAWRYGIGLDQKLPGACFAGFEYAIRELKVPFTQISDIGVVEKKDDDWKEQTGKVYFYWPASSLLTFGAEYRYEKFDHDQWEGPQRIRKLVTRRLIPNIHFFHPSGFTGIIQASYIEQDGEFGFTPFGFKSDSDSFWVVDASIHYRLPRRRGILKLAVKNLLDQQFNFLDTDVANPQILPERQLIGSFTLSF